jgi:hypothetical protein
MPNTTLLDREILAPGTTTTRAIPAPHGGTLGYVAADLDDDRVATAGLRLTLSLEVSTDHGATWYADTDVVWDSGPANAAQAVGLPRPRPITGITAVDSKHTKVRGKVVVALTDGTTSVALGLNYATLDS